VIGSDAISLLFKAKGDTSDAKKAFNDLEGSIAGSTGAVAGLAGALPIAGAAIAAMAAIVVSAASGLYNLTKSAAEYAGAIFDVQEKTGLSAATLSTLKLNADNAGSSLEAISGSAGKFAKVIGEASAGNEKAQATLKALNVTSTDLDTGLKQAIKTIYEADSGTQQLVLAQKAFGKSGGDLIPVIKQMGGDLEAATKEAERLGTTLTEKDLQASDAFGDALGVLSAQAKAAAVAFTSDLMPVLTRYFTMASEWYAENKQIIRDWGATIAYVVASFARGMVVSFNVIRENAEILRGVLAGLTFGISEMVYWAGSLIGQYVRAKQTAAGGTAQEGSGQAAVAPNFPGGGGPKGGGKGRAGKSSTQSAEEAQAKKDLQDQLELQQRYLKRYEEIYKETLTRIREEFKKTGDGAALVSAADEALTKFRQATAAAFARIDELTPAAQSQAEQDLLNDDKLQRIKAFNDLMKASVDATNALIAEAAKKNADIRLQIEQKLTDDLIAENTRQTEQYIENEERAWDELIANQEGFYDEQNKLRGEAFNALNTALETEKNRRLASLQDQKAAERKRIEESVKDEESRHKLIESLDELYKKKAEITEEEFQRRIEEIKNKYAIPVDGGADAVASPLFGLMGALSEFKDMALDAFSSFASGIGSMIQNWVLLGETGPAAMRKLTASVLAGLAAQAAVKSLFYLAEGIAALFWNPAAAAGYFTASAIMGGIAVGAAVTGRAIAGDAFKQQSKGAVSSAASGSRSSSGGSVYSSQANQIIESSRNSPGEGGVMSKFRSDITLKIVSTKDHIVQVVKENIGNNGALRTVIQDATG